MISKRFGVVFGLMALSAACCATTSMADEASSSAPASASVPLADNAGGSSEQSAKPADTTAMKQATTNGAQARDVLPGPLFPERQALFDHIQQAGLHGIGTASYKMVFKSIEQQVAAGAAETQIKPKVSELNDALKEQLMRAQVLKTQRPLPPTASQQGDAAPPAMPAAAAGGLGSLGNSALIEKLKDKLGGGGVPSPDVVEKFLNSDKAKDLLKKLGQ